MKATLFYIHDPMCSWCWGFSQSLSELLTKLPADIKVKRLLGGLAPDTDSAMPQSMQEQIKNNWARIEDTIPEVKFNFDFWSETTPRRSTYPDCRAVIAARLQNEKFDTLMTKAIQNAYYQQARNPSNDSTLIELASELNLILEDFIQDLNSIEIKNRLMFEINLSRELFAESYPSLVLKVNDDIFSIAVEYNDSQLMLNSINEILKKY